MRTPLLALTFLVAAIMSGCGYQLCAQAGQCGAASTANIQTSATNPAADIHQALRDRLIRQERLGGSNAIALHIDSESLRRDVVARDAKSQPLQFEWVALVTATANEQSQTFEARRRFLANGNNLLTEENLSEHTKKQAIAALVTQLQRFANKAPPQ